MPALAIQAALAAIRVFLDMAATAVVMAAAGAETLVAAAAIANRQLRADDEGEGISSSVDKGAMNERYWIAAIKPLMIAIPTAALLGFAG
jgi:hypothetical protein